MSSVGIRKRSVSYVDSKPSISVVDSFLAILFALYPVLPSYTIIFGLRLHSLLSFASFFVLLIISISRNYKFTKSFLFFVSFVILLLTLSSLVNGDFFTTSFISIVAQFIFVSVFLFYTLSEKSNKKIYFKAAIIIGLLTCVLSISELFGFNVFSLICNKENPGAMGPTTGQRFGIYRIESSFGQAIAYAIYLTYILILIFYYIYKYKSVNKKRNLLLVALILFVDVFIFLTMSRLPIIIAALVNVFGFFSLSRKNKEYFLLLAFLFICFLTIFGLLFNSSLIFSFLNNIVSVFKGGEVGEYNPFKYRLGLYSYIGQMFEGPKEWLFGVGLSTEYAFYAPTGYGGYVLHRSIDNGYLSILASQGFVGLFAWMLFYLFLLNLFIKVYRGTIRSNDRKIGLFGIVIIAVTLLNMLSVARLDESRAFCVFIPLLLSCCFKKNKSQRTNNIRHRICA